MSLQFQLSDARNDPGISAVSGVCNDSAAFRDQLNQVIRQLMKRGGWFGTQVMARFCVHGCKVTLPRYVGAIVGARNCATGQLDIKNNWYSILGPNLGSEPFASNLTLRDENTAPTYNDVSGTEGKKIAYHVVKNADIGKAITIYGFDSIGQPLQQLISGVWQMGVTITASAAGGATLPAMTTQLVSRITNIVRAPTSGMAYLYEYGPDANGTNALRDLAAYEPNETNPNYRRLSVLGYAQLPKKTDSYGREIASIEAMVNLEYVPLVNDYDFLLIDDFDALRFGVQALKKDAAGDAQASEIWWAKAIRELNYRERSKLPGNQISVKVRTMGSNRIIQNPI